MSKPPYIDDEEWALRKRLVDAFEAGGVELPEAQDELRAYKDPEFAELLRFRKREPFVQSVITTWKDDKAGFLELGEPLDNLATFGPITEKKEGGAS